MEKRLVRRQRSIIPTDNDPLDESLSYGYALISLSLSLLAHQPTRVLADFQLEAARDAVSESAKKQFTLEAVEVTARQIIAENPQSEWPTQRDCARLGYQVSWTSLRLSTYDSSPIYLFRSFQMLVPILLSLSHQRSVQASRSSRAPSRLVKQLLRIFLTLGKLHATTISWSSYYLKMILDNRP